MNLGIEFKDLDFGYGDELNLFNNLNWQSSLAPSEILAILGPSGSGKSTLLRLLAGLEHPHRGSVWLDGEEITALRPSDRRFVMVYQERTLFPGSIKFNLDFALRCRGVTDDERKYQIKRLLQLVGLGGYEKKSVDALSGGERQRVELARALAAEPRLLLLDEPLGQLDISLKRSLVEQIRDWVKSQRIRAIYVTHDTEEAFTIADKLTILFQGQLSIPRPPAEVYLNPMTVSQAQLTGALNLLEGIVHQTDSQRSIIHVETYQFIEIQSPSVVLSPNQPIRLGFRPTRIQQLATRPVSSKGTGFHFSGVLDEVRLIDGLLWGEIFLDTSRKKSLLIAQLDQTYRQHTVGEFVVPSSDLLLFSEEGNRIIFENCRTIK